MWMSIWAFQSASQPCSADGGTVSRSVRARSNEPLAMADFAAVGFVEESELRRQASSAPRIVPVQVLAKGALGGGAAAVSFVQADQGFRESFPGRGVPLVRGEGELEGVSGLTPLPALRGTSGLRRRLAARL